MADLSKDRTSPLRIRTRSSFSLPAAEFADLEQFLIGPYQARGLLLKLNSKGTWQKRLYELRGSYLCYWASEAKQKTGKDGAVSPPDAAVDLRAAQKAEWEIDSHQLVITSDNGVEIRLKAPSLKDEAHMPQWLRAVKASTQHLSPKVTKKSIAPDHIPPPIPPEAPVVEEAPEVAAEEEDGPTVEDEHQQAEDEEQEVTVATDGLLLSGILEKKGGGTSLFGRRNWKQRFFVLYHDRLSYYESERAASEKADEPLGTISFRDQCESGFSAPLQVVEREAEDRSGVVPTLLLSRKDGRIFALRALDSITHAAWESKLRKILGMGFKAANGTM